MSAFNQSADRTFVYENSVFQIDGNGGPRTMGFVKNWNFTPNMSDFDIDRIDSAAPIFTKKSDILGTFSFDTVSTVDLYGAGGDADNPVTYAFWATQIALGEPPTITFFVKMNAPKSSGDKFGNIQFSGRVMSCPVVRLANTGTQTVSVNGEIIQIGPITRTAS